MKPTEINVLLDTYRKLFRRRAKKQIKNMFVKTHPAETSEIFIHFSKEERLGIFRLMDDEYAAEVIRDLDEIIAVEVLTNLTPNEVVKILKHVPSDDEADLLGYLSEEIYDTIMNLMKDEESTEIEELLKYDPTTAGGIMTPQYLALDEETTVKDAINSLQESDEAETAFYLYVIDERNHLVGVLSLRQLITNPSAKKLSDIMIETPISVQTDVHQEEVAQLVSRYNIIAIPVVDDENKLLGIITVDDVIDVIREEATEDFFVMAGAGSDKEILLKSTFSAVKLRFPWLLASWVGGIVASIIIGFYDKLLTEWVIIAAYMPIIVGMGGNIGTQTSTIIVRGLATSRVTIKSAWGVLWKELRIGLTLGIMYGVLLAIIASFITDNPLAIGIAAGLGILASMTLATLTGAIAPIVLHRFDIDPAVAAGPFVTTTIDIVGIAVYLLIAAMLLGG